MKIVTIVPPDILRHVCNITVKYFNKKKFTFLFWGKFTLIYIEFVIFIFQTNIPCQEFSLRGALNASWKQAICDLLSSVKPPNAKKLNSQAARLLLKIHITLPGS